MKIKKSLFGLAAAGICLLSSCSGNLDWNKFLKIADEKTYDFNDLASKYNNIKVELKFEVTKEDEIYKPSVDNYEAGEEFYRDEDELKNILMSNDYLSGLNLYDKTTPDLYRDTFSSRLRIGTGEYFYFRILFNGYFINNIKDTYNRNNSYGADSIKASMKLDVVDNEPTFVLENAVKEEYYSGSNFKANSSNKYTVTYGTDGLLKGIVYERSFNGSYYDSDEDGKVVTKQADFAYKKTYTISYSKITPPAE